MNLHNKTRIGYSPSEFQEIQPLHSKAGKEAEIEPDIVKGKRLTPEPYRRTGCFVRGPIPWDWILAASQPPGAELLLGMFLLRFQWYAKKNTQGWIKFQRKTFMKETGVSDRQVTRILQKLTESGLIQIRRESGKLSKILILRAETKDWEGDGKNCVDSESGSESVEGESA